MELLTQCFLPVFFAFVASCGFAVIYNIHGPGILICGFGGGMGWLAYLLAEPLGNDITRTLLAAIVIAAYSEVMARLRRCPVTGYLLVGIFPLVPGGGVYYTMEHAVNGENALFLDSFLHTLGLAGALAVGVLLVSSFVRLWHAFRYRTTHRKENAS